MPSKKFECDKCGRTFHTEEACEVHEETCKDKKKGEENDESGEWLCSHCGREFSKKSLAEAHERNCSEKRRSGGGGKWVFLIIILIILGIWGWIGGVVAQDVGVTCDIGIGGTFCWKWHKNTVGQIVEGINDLFGND
jgi:hypothetical protein